jgi:septum formation protein
MNISKNTKIILASSSPRRIELLKGLGLKFEILPANIDETISTSPSPVAIARQLAVQKAFAVQQKINRKEFTNTLIIAGDTIVILGKKILGKPTTKAEAIKMLTRLSGKTHLVITGLCILKGKKKVVGHEITKVTFQKLSKRTIRKYVNTGEPMDKAGAYGIQGKAALLVKKIEGDYFNVMGLPLALLSEMLKNFRIQLL